MVKILQAYNFAKQNTFSLNGEILAATLINSNRIAISSAEQFIEIYDIAGKEDFHLQQPQQQQIDNNINLSTTTTTEAAGSDERLPAKYTLASVGEVVNLIYCEGAKYLLTLEKEDLGSPVHSNSTSIGCTSSTNNIIYSDEDTKMFVRIYANFWKFPEAKLINLPITIRIASMTTPKAPLLESIDVIELPLRSPPDIIQCCQTSGNIIVSSKDRIYLYEYTQCTHESTQPRFSYIDFLPFKFFVSLNFTPLKLNLAENVIACMNNRYCVAFKIVDMVSSTASGVTAHPMYDGYDADTAAGDVYGEEPISSSESSMISKGSAVPSSRNSFEIDSLETMSSEQQLGATGGFPGHTPIDFNVARMVNTAGGREFEVNLKSQWDQSDSAKSSTSGGILAQDIIIYPTRARDIKIKLVNEAKAMNVQRIGNHCNGAQNSYREDPSVQYDIRKLLQICMKTSEPKGRIVDILRCVDLKAIYQRNAKVAATVQQAGDGDFDMGNQQIPSAITTSKHAHRRTLKSQMHQKCIGFSLLVASSVDGYLYQFCAQGKWYNENEKPIASYSFTAPVLHVHINDYVIYAITTESVETHTSRLGHKLFNNRFEYPSIGSLFPEESSPDVNAAIAVIGLCSFMNVQYVCVNRENLVLISNSGDAAANIRKRSSTGSNITAATSASGDKRNVASRLLAEAKAKHKLLRNGTAAQQSVINEWTLYNLEIPRIEHIIDDLEAIAESYLSASSSNFYDLMEEAHVMLRMSLSLQFENFNAAREKYMREKFIENCHKLADFSIRSRKKEIYLQAIGFYKMCNMELTDIYKNCIVNLAKTFNNEETGTATNTTDHKLEIDDLIGLIYTVKSYLLTLGTDRLKAVFLNQQVKPFFTPSRVIEKGFPQVPLSLEFLNMFIKYSAADIPHIMLISPVVADSISGELINYLKYIDDLNPDENLLLAVSACRKSDFILAHKVINKTSRRDLAVALIKYKNVLFDDGTILYHKNLNPLRTSKYTRSTRFQHNPRHAMLSHNVAGNAQNTVSFSEFTEILFLVTDPELVEGISDVFIHALCIERIFNLDLIIKLFLNYLASHVGVKGYQTTQKIFVNMLQVYFYDFLDVNPLQQPHDLTQNNTLPPMKSHADEATVSRTPSLNSERDTESIANSIGESNSRASSSMDDRYVSAIDRSNRIGYDHLQDLSSPHRQPFHASPSHHGNNALNVADDIVNLKGLKTLFRLYMGRLNELTELAANLQSADVEQQAEDVDFQNMRKDCIRFMVRHMEDIRDTKELNQQAFTQEYYYPKLFKNVNATSESNKKMVFVPLIPDYKLTGEAFERHLKTYIRPIPGLLERPQFLNHLPPFKSTDFSYPNKDEGECEVKFIGWHNELLTLTLKIQALLASPRIYLEVVEDFISFIEKTSKLIGVDSLLVIVLPKTLAINYLLHFCPDGLWRYGKSNGFTPEQWKKLLNKLVDKQEQIPNWKPLINEILANLVAELPFEELMLCFPNEAIPDRNPDLYVNSTVERFEKDSERNGYLCSRNHLPMDNIDENNVFELILRKAVSKQRSIALRSMIESTGSQLFDATNNPMYNL